LKSDHDKLFDGKVTANAACSKHSRVFNRWRYEQLPSIS
jgi:hypothetical protein